jgi:hypothetical protein
MVAALLFQHHIPVTDFLGDLGRASDVIGVVGLRHRGLYETMALLILKLSPRRQQANLFEIERIKNIYHQMMRFHW